MTRDWGRVDRGRVDRDRGRVDRDMGREDRDRGRVNSGRVDRGSEDRDRGRVDKGRDRGEGQGHGQSGEGGKNNSDHSKTCVRWASASFTDPTVTRNRL